MSKFYVFLDVDGNLGSRTSQYIEKDEPGFWSNNQGFFLRVWKVDVGDLDSCYRLLKGFASLKLPTAKVNELCSSIGIKMEEVREYAGKLN